MRRTDRSGHPEALGLSDACSHRLRRHVLAWYDERRRDLPWRRTPSLFGIWISEMMLQQTTVAAVAPYWQRFVARFPDVASLAAASVADVLTLWSGLGYYRRAHHLHAAAREIMAHHGGRLPDTAAGWRALPGVGPYAAGAIASIGLGLPVPAVDANVRRVIARWLAPDAAAAAAIPRGFVERVAADLVDPQRPGDWNQALMELGATVCRARAVACAVCPARGDCRAATGTDPAAVGRLPDRRPPVKVLASALVVVCDDRVLLLPTSEVVVMRVRGLGHPLRDDLGGLHPGLYAPPQTPWYPRVGVDPVAPLHAAWRAWLRGAQIRVSSLSRAGQVRHAITQHELLLEVFRADLDPSAAASLEALVGPGRRWSTLRERADGTALPALTTPARRCLALGRTFPKTG